MGKIKTFEDLVVWQDAADLAVNVYNISACGKLSKDFGLRDQIQRASISVSNNIAEGFEYDNNKDFIKFLRFAKGSTGEVRNIMHFLNRVNFIDNNTHDKMCTDLISLSSQLKGFISYLRKYINNQKNNL